MASPANSIYRRKAMESRRVLLDPKWQAGLETTAEANRKNPTHGEKAVLSLLELEGLTQWADFRFQAVIVRYIVDFLFPSLGLVVEVDGRGHETPKGQAADARKDSLLGAMGYRVLRIPNAQALGSPQMLKRTLFAVLAECESLPAPTIRPMAMKDTFPCRRKRKPGRRVETTTPKVAEPLGEISIASRKVVPFSNSGYKIHRRIDGGAIILCCGHDFEEWRIADVPRKGYALALEGLEFEFYAMARKQ